MFRRRLNSNDPTRALTAVSVSGFVAIAISLPLALLGGEEPEAARADAVAVSAPTKSKPPWGFHSTWSWYCAKPSGETTLIPARLGCHAGERRVTPEQQIAASAAAGTPIARLALNWSSVEPDAPTRDGSGAKVHEYRWGQTDLRYGAMLSKRIKPIIVPFDAPVWARPPQWRNFHCEATCAYAPDERFRSDWRAFVQAVMERYPRALAIEVWNEANSVRFSQPGPDPSGYPAYCTPPI
jgi:hypothetical protein